MQKNKIKNKKKLDKQIQKLNTGRVEMKLSIN